MTIGITRADTQISSADALVGEVLEADGAGGVAWVSQKPTRYFWVSDSEGSDTNDGSDARPLKTIGAAQAAARLYKDTAGETAPVHVYVDPAQYVERIIFNQCHTIVYEALASTHQAFNRVILADGADVSTQPTAVVTNMDDAGYAAFLAAGGLARTYSAGSYAYTGADTVGRSVNPIFDGGNFGQGGGQKQIQIEFRGFFFGSSQGNSKGAVAVIAAPGADADASLEGVTFVDCAFSPVDTGDFSFFGLNAFRLAFENCSLFTGTSPIILDNCSFTRFSNSDQISGDLLITDGSSVAGLPEQPFLFGRFAVGKWGTTFPLLDVLFDDATGVGRFINEQALVQCAGTIYTRGGFAVGVNDTGTLPVKKIMAGAVDLADTSVIRASQLLCEGGATLADGSRLECENATIGGDVTISGTASILIDSGEVLGNVAVTGTTATVTLPSVIGTITASAGQTVTVRGDFDPAGFSGGGTLVHLGRFVPILHATSHAQGAADEIDAADLGSGGAAAATLLTADGAGGADWSPPAAAGHATWAEDEFTSTLGQITFIIGGAPTDLGSFSLHVNGVLYDDVTDYVLSGTTVTWLNTEFSLVAGDVVHARYY